MDCQTLCVLYLMDDDLLKARQELETLAMLICRCMICQVSVCEDL